MIQTTFLFFLTLVLFQPAGFASPHNEAPPDQTEKVDETPVDQSVTDRISITPVAPPKTTDEYSRAFSREDYFYNHRKAITVHGGFVFGFQDSSDDEDLVNGIIGVSYLLPWNTRIKTEVGADLSFVGNGHFTIMRRRIYNDKSAYRPYYRYGLMLISDPDDKLAFISDWDRYLARAGVGFEDSRWPSKSLRVELEFAVGTKDVLGLFSLGYVWGI